MKKVWKPYNFKVSASTYLHYFKANVSLLLYGHITDEGRCTVIIRYWTPIAIILVMGLSMLAPTPPLPGGGGGGGGGEVRQSWGFDLIRIQLPHPPGNVRIQIPPSYIHVGSDRGFDGTRTACVSHAHFSDSISRPLGQACHSKQGKFPTLSRVGGGGGGWGLTLVGT